MLATQQLPLEVELELGRSARAGDMAARDRLIEHHLWIVVYVANSMRWVARGGGLEIEDVEAEAGLALVKVAGEFDPERGCRFSTLAVVGVRNALLKVADAKRYRRPPPTADPAELQEFVASSEPGPNPVEDRDTAEAMLDKLPDRLARIMRLRFGLDDGKERTLEEVGHVLGVSRERIRQLEAKSLAILRGEKWPPRPRSNPSKSRGVRRRPASHFGGAILDQILRPQDLVATPACGRHPGP